MLLDVRCVLLSQQHCCNGIGIAWIKNEADFNYQAT